MKSEKCFKTLSTVASDGAKVTCGGRPFQRLALEIPFADDGEVER